MFVVSVDLYRVVVDLQIHTFTVLCLSVLNVYGRLMHLNMFHVVGALLVPGLCHVPEAERSHSCRVGEAPAAILRYNIL